MLYYNISHERPRPSPRPSPSSSGPRASAGLGASVDPAAVGGAAARLRRRLDRARLGSRRSGRCVSMTAQLQFRNLTLGYDRHPAVHHLDGAVQTRLADRRGRAERRRQVDAVQGRGRRDQAARRAHRAQRRARRRTSPICRRSPRSTARFPISVYDMVAMGLWRSKGLFGGIGPQDRDTVEGAIAAVGLTGFEQRPIGTLSGGQMQRMLFARLLLQDARVIVLDEPFNAIDAKTSADLLALVRRWHSEQRTVLAALHDLDVVKANFPEALLLAREPVAWGATADVLTAGEHAEGAPDVRGLRRAGRSLRRGGGRLSRHAVPDIFRALRDESGPPFDGRRAGAGAERGPRRRVPDAAAHEPRWRCDVARHPAGRRARLSRRRTQCLRHDVRRARRRSPDRGSRRRGEPRHHVAGGCFARGVSPRVARLRRGDRDGQRHRRRATHGVPVRRDGGENECRQACGDRRQRHDQHDRAGADLSAAGARLRRSGISCAR